MRRQFVSNVAFYSTTAVLILIIVLCIGATVKSESRDETQRMENRIQEQQLMSDMKQYLNENGYRNSGVTLTYALEEDGSPVAWPVHYAVVDDFVYRGDHRLRTFRSRIWRLCLAPMPKKTVSLTT